MNIINKLKTDRYLHHKQNYSPTIQVLNPIKFMIIERIDMIHCSDADFHESFINDLAHSENQVIILSPFLSQRRASRYYSIFSSLSARQVEILIFVKPKAEQPFEIRNHYEGVENCLTNAGAIVHERAGMHEKIAFIDEKIVWHGSLNILSHNETKESMLRVECQDLVKELLSDLKIEVFHKASSDLNENDTNIKTLADQECPECGAEMKLYRNIAMWLCKNSPSCSGSSSYKESTGGLSDDPDDISLDLSCPLCNSGMQIHKGLNLRIICSSAECGFSLDRRLSDGLIRMFKRRCSK
ncbi:MAG: phospholipase D-like domain-containing protein [Candidatus Eremiobacteraeota bacterium]|nr:phospholipase D-like domain-containing protein [Candidatus Eremiobacteraeota bacterium]